LIRYLADVLDVPRGAVRITHGLTNRRKTIEIAASELKLEAVKQTLMPSSGG
jgi:hypothetical protein